uniref:Protein kinase domain-containing protein n=1 Tax=Biomphalaria glabrata TaxID=6526 RepID=A0A2C9K9C7_BIOGL
MSLFIQVYIYEAKKILKFLTEKQRNIEETVLGLQDFFKYFSTYNTISNLAHVELHAYIDGLFRLASIPQFADLMKEGDILVHVHNNVQHVNDQMIYKSYLHLITTLGFPATNDFRKTNRRATSATDTSASGSTKPKTLNGEDTPPYDYIDVAEDRDVHYNTMGKYPTERDLQSLYNQMSPLKRSQSLGVVAETLKPDGKEESCFSFGTNKVINPSTVTVLPRFLTSKEMNHSLQHTDELEDIEIPITAIQFINIVDKGNFSIVRKGNLNNRTMVAVKSMIPHEMSTQQFLFEAVLLKRLDHPKIVKILKVVIEEPISHIVLEFLSNGNLHAYLENGGLQNGTLKDIVNIAVQIVDGMAFVHKQKIIHCDLRAANILVGNDNNVKIADFGLARTLHNNNGNHLLKDRFPIRWTAPEGLLSDQFSLKSDVWSFGIVMYELITFGREPYTGYSNDEVKELIKKGEKLSRPTNLPLKDIPESYYEIMYSCCDFSSQNRPSFLQVQVEFMRNYQVQET